MQRLVASLVAGLFFGIGLAVSQMVNPAKVVAFLDLAGKWDPSLAFVMVGGFGVVAGNLLADIFLAVLDPRIRYS